MDDHIACIGQVVTRWCTGRGHAIAKSNAHPRWRPKKCLNTPGQGPRGFPGGAWKRQIDLSPCAHSIRFELH